MKRLLLVIALLFSTATLIHAQDGQKKQQFQWNKKQWMQLV